MFYIALVFYLYWVGYIKHSCIPVQGVHVDNSTKQYIRDYRVMMLVSFSYSGSSKIPERITCENGFACIRELLFNLLYKQFS